MSDSLNKAYNLIGQSQPQSKNTVRDKIFNIDDSITDSSESGDFSKAKQAEDENPHMGAKRFLKRGSRLLEESILLDVENKTNEASEQQMGTSDAESLQKVEVISEKISEENDECFVDFDELTSLKSKERVESIKLSEEDMESIKTEISNGQTGISILNLNEHEQIEEVEEILDQTESYISDFIETQSEVTIQESIGLKSPSHEQLISRNEVKSFEGDNEKNVPNLNIPPSKISKISQTEEGFEKVTPMIGSCTSCIENMLGLEGTFVQLLLIKTNTDLDELLYTKTISCIKPDHKYVSPNFKPKVRKWRGRS